MGRWGGLLGSPFPLSKAKGGSAARDPPRRTHTHTDRHTDSHTQTQTHRNTETHTHRHKQTDRHTHRQVDRQTDRHTERHTHRQTHRHTDIQTHRRTDTQTHRLFGCSNDFAQTLDPRDGMMRYQHTRCTLAETQGHTLTLATGSWALPWMTTVTKFTPGNIGKN